MKYQEALKSLQYGRDNKYVLIGSEPYFKEQFLKAAKAFYPAEEFLVFSPDSWEEALGHLYSGSLFGDGTVVLRDFNKMKPEKFEPMLNDVPGRIIMSITEGANVRSRIMSKIISKSTEVECNKLKEFGKEYPLWITSKISSAGYGADGEAVDTLYMRVGPNLFSLSNELKKLFIYKDNDRQINKTDVERVVSHTAIGSSYDTLYCLLRHDVSGALKILDPYLKNYTDYTELVHFLGHYMEKIYRILLLHEDKFSADSISEVIGIPRFIVKTRYLPRALALGKSKIANYMDKISALEIDLRRTLLNKRVIFERFIFNFSS